MTASSPRHVPCPQQADGGRGDAAGPASVERQGDVERQAPVVEELEALPRDSAELDDDEDWPNLAGLPEDDDELPLEESPAQFALLDRFVPGIGRKFRGMAQVMEDLERHRGQPQQLAQLHSKAKTDADPCGLVPFEFDHVDYAPKVTNITELAAEERLKTEVFTADTLAELDQLRRRVEALDFEQLTKEQQDQIAAVWARVAQNFQDFEPRRMMPPPRLGQSREDAEAQRQEFCRRLREEIQRIHDLAAAAAVAAATDPQHEGRVEEVDGYLKEAREQRAAAEALRLRAEEAAEARLSVGRARAAAQEALEARRRQRQLCGEAYLEELGAQQAAIVRFVEAWEAFEAASTRLQDSELRKECLRSRQEALDAAVKAAEEDVRRLEALQEPALQRCGAWEAAAAQGHETANLAVHALDDLLAHRSSALMEAIAVHRYTADKVLRKIEAGGESQREALRADLQQIPLQLQDRRTRAGAARGDDAMQLMIEEGRFELLEAVCTGQLDQVAATLHRLREVQLPTVQDRCDRLRRLHGLAERLAWAGVYEQAAATAERCCPPLLVSRMFREPANTGAVEVLQQNGAVQVLQPPQQDGAVQVLQPPQQDGAVQVLQPPQQAVLEALVRAEVQRILDQTRAEEAQRRLQEQRRLEELRAEEVQRRLDELRAEEGTRTMESELDFELLSDIRAN